MVMKSRGVSNNEQMRAETSFRDMNTEARAPDFIEVHTQSRQMRQRIQNRYFSGQPREFLVDKIDESQSDTVSVKEVNLWDVLHLRCHLRDKVNQWVEKSKIGMSIFEGNSRTAALRYVARLGPAAANPNDGSVLTERIIWEGGPNIPACIIAAIVPSAIEEGYAHFGEDADKLELLVTDLLNEEFEEIVLDRINTAGADLTDLAELTELIDSLNLPAIPTDQEIFRDLLLGYASANNIHIRGGDWNLKAYGGYYFSWDTDFYTMIDGQRISGLLNEIPNQSLPHGRGSLHQPVEYNAP